MTHADHDDKVLDEDLERVSAETLASSERTISTPVSDGGYEPVFEEEEVVQ